MPGNKKGKKVPESGLFVAIDHNCIYLLMTNDYGFDWILSDAGCVCAFR